MKGRLKVIVGPMASGKSEHLISQMRREAIAKRRVLVFKPIDDTRNAIDEISSRNGTHIEAVTIKEPSDIIYHVFDEECKNKVDVVGIDEVQFFESTWPANEEIFGVIEQLLDAGINVYVSGLNKDFLGKPFMVVATLMAIADEVKMLTSVCSKCHSQDASFTQKLVGDKPAPFNSPRFEAGGDDRYCARCRDCHEIGV